MATIADVARGAGVSRTAVSFAFNQPDQLAEETLRRILEVANELGYYPNPAARSLNTGRTGIIGVLIPQRAAIVCSNPFLLDFLKGVGHVSDRHGLTILLVSPVRGSLTHAMNNVPVDGFIALGLGKRQREVGLLCRRSIPFVVVDAQPPEGVSAVESDDAAGAEAAAAHLLDAGHRDILIVGVHPPRGDDDHADGAADDYDVTHRRLRGYERAFAARGLALPARPDRLILVDSTLEAGERALAGAVRAGQAPSAVLAMSDILALGVVRQARELGLRVPNDLSVVGFDDILAAAHSCPALTTVRQPIVEKGKQAAQLLTDHLNGRTEPVRRVFPTALVLRETVAAPRPR